MRTPVVLGCALGLLLGASGATLPVPVARPVELIAATAVPVSLLAYGTALHGAARPGTGVGAGEVRLVVVVMDVVQPTSAGRSAATSRAWRGSPCWLTVTSALPTAQKVDPRPPASSRGLDPPGAPP